MAGHVTRLDVSYGQRVRIGSLDETVAAGTATVSVSDTFAVTPAAAQCTATATVGTLAVTTGVGGVRAVRLDVGRRAATETVTCAHGGHDPASATFAAAAAGGCGDPQGTLSAGSVTRSGTIAQNPACVSPQRRTNGGSSKHYPARRHTFTLANPAAVRIDVGPPTRRGLDTFVVLLEGHSQDGSGTVLGRDNNSGPRNGARLAGLRLAPGDYTIEATTANKRRTGNYDLRVDAQLDVLIANLDGNSRVGTGTATDYFTVLPADATCTPTAGTVTDLGSGRRILSAGITALGDTDITVTCRRAGYGTATAASTLTALTPVSDVTVDAASGGTCKPYRGTLDAGVDQAFACTLTAGTPLTVDAEATGPSSQMKLVWTAQAGATVMTPDDGDLSVSVVGGEVVFARSGTGTVTCSTDAEVTLDVEVGETAEHTTVLKIDCEPPVQITNYSPGTRHGAGAMTGTFDVAPAAARCTAAHAGGIAGRATAEGTGTGRAVAAATTATGWFDVEVSCEAAAAGYADATATARFWAYDDAVCVTDLGTLGHGPRTESGTIAQDIRCKSYRRDTAHPERSYYARRHTFTMATAGWVSLDLEAAGSGPHGLDMYLLLLYRHGSGGAERARDDNSGTSGNAQLADLFLAAGTYTIEATTATAGATGGYRLSIDADFAAQAPDQPPDIDADVGQTITRTWSYLPADATATVQSVTPDGLDATVFADQGSATLTATATRTGDYTVTVAYTASGHTHTINTVIEADCPPRHSDSATRTCVPKVTALPAGCSPASLQDGHYWRDEKYLTTYEIYGAEAAPECISLSQNSMAAYFRFEVSASLEALFEFKAADSDGAGTHLFRLGGAPSMTLWHLRHHPIHNDTLGLIAISHTTATDSPTIELTIDSGIYVLELANSVPVRVDGPATLRTALPLGSSFYSDVKYLSNVGLGGNGMSLGQFLEARGSIKYANHPDTSRRTDIHNTHDPMSRNYPWLAFWTDKCSIPSALTPLTNNINLKDFPVFDGVEVPFVYGCMRHDFAWRNLYRAEHYYHHIGDNPKGPWRLGTMNESNGRLGLDLMRLCRANGSPTSPDSESPHFTWSILRDATNPDEALSTCDTRAGQVKLGVGTVLPFISKVYYPPF